MDLEQGHHDLLLVLKKHWLPVGLFCIGLVFLIYGLISFFPFANKSSEITFQPAESTEKTDAATQNERIVVDVAGAVVRPGVYTLSSESRIQDALVAAGGFSEKADRVAIAQKLNLASPLTDGAKLYVPFIGETVVAGNATSDSQQATININTVTEKELDTLPGVGEVTVKKIVDNRPYQNINQLLEKKIVTQKVFEQIKTQISVY